MLLLVAVAAGSLVIILRNTPDEAGELQLHKSIATLQKE